MAIDISLSITDPILCDGVKYAMDLYNAGLTEDEEKFTNEADYVAWVGRQAVISYAKQKIQLDYDSGVINKTTKDAILEALSK